MMMKPIFRFEMMAFTAIISFLLPLVMKGQPFVHPGLNQSSADLAFMKQQVLAGVQPYKAAFDRLKSATDTVFTAKPHAHVLRGPYGRPNIGGDDLARSAEMAYNNALVWHITGNRQYAEKAIGIINAWSPVLHDFDYNDAKLLAAWTGHVWCNAAEILRHTDAGWKQTDIDRFTNMLLTVYYPLIRFYFPQANGNWDGAIIHSIMAIGIFTDNRSLFNNAVDHFLHGPVNGSIFKYIYPSGQCQESTRDQGHVQLGLGEFAGAAQIAFTQGVDLFSAGNNRLALGYEYTAGFLLGRKPQCYGTISERAKGIRDDYEAVYRHYTAQGIDMPFSKRAADSIRPKASRSILSAVRTGLVKGSQHLVPLKPDTTGYPAGPRIGSFQGSVPDDALVVAPGQSVQATVDSAAGTGRLILLKAGIHRLPRTLQMRSRITMMGEDTGTVLFLDPASGDRDAIVNAEEDMHDVTLTSLTIEGSVRTDPGTDPNSNRSFRSGSSRGGIIFRSGTNVQMRNINLFHVSVQNCTYNGVFISGAIDVTIFGCDFTENGSSIVPGPKLQHNLLLAHCFRGSVQHCRLDTSPFGSGVTLDHCTDIPVVDCEIARNAYYGVLITESKNIYIARNLIEGNDRSGVMLEFLHQGSEAVTVTQNRIHYNSGYGLEAYAVKSIRLEKNIYQGNGNQNVQEKQSSEKRRVMD